MRRFEHDLVTFVYYKMTQLDATVKDIVTDDGQQWNDLCAR